MTSDDFQDLTNAPTDTPRRGADDVDDVRAAVAGDDHAFARLYDKWFDRVYDLASRVVRDQQLAADVAQDTFLSAYRNLANLTDPYAFGGWLLRIARNRAFDRSERERRVSAVDDTQMAIIERGGGAVTAPRGFAVEDRLTRAERPEDAVEDDEIVALVWGAADALGERDREVLDLHLRHGLEPGEIAEIIGVSRNAANQTMHRVRKRLATAIAARVLWRSGSPKCAELRAVLAAAELPTFDAETVRLVDRHAGMCGECSERARLRLEPAALFSAVPMISIPALKARVAAALTAQGVPVTPHHVAGSEAGSVSESASDVDAPNHGSVGGADGGSDRTALGAPTELDDGALHGPRRRAMVVSACIALLMVVLAIGYTVLPASDGAVVTQAPPQVTEPNVAPTAAMVTATTRDVSGATSTAPRGATTTASQPIVAPTSPPASTGVPLTPATTVPAATTTVPPLNPRGTLRISRSSVAMPGYALTDATAPRLSWSTTDVAAVVVSGPNLSATELDGSTVVCPGVSSASTCTLTPSLGTVTYSLLGYDKSGVLVVERSVTLTVTL